MGQSSGYLQFFKVPELNELSKVQVGDKGVVSDIKRSKRGNNELAVSTYKGLFFGKVEGYEFKENIGEKFFEGKTVTSFWEYDLDKFIVCVCNQSEYVQMVDRSTSQVLTKI